MSTMTMRSRRNYFGYDRLEPTKTRTTASLLSSSSSTSSSSSSSPNEQTTRKIKTNDLAIMTDNHDDIDENNHHSNKGDVKPSTKQLRWQRNALLLLCILLVVWDYSRRSRQFPYSSQLFHGKLLRQNNSSTKDCLIDLGEYRGPQYRSVPSGMIGQPICLLSSKWISVSLHTVRFPGSHITYDDWMWIDYHDRINVLVEDNMVESKEEEQDENKEERRFWVFEQTKYALEGKTSWAIIGGIIEPGEDPETAARREVQQEMKGLVCETFHFLGRYRTDVNRGMGWLNSFLATQCSYPPPQRQKEQQNSIDLVDEVGAADTEQQQLKSITLTELKQAARDGKFMEVQWTATVAQALLHPELNS
jgi:ADP-ribose pyrophosphatase YjhB (NUDIX family)